MVTQSHGIVNGALRSVRVLDFSRVRAGPTCVRMLADFGADVIRIEPPADTDPNASMFADDRFGSDFQNLNRNKRSLTLNLKHEGAREIVARLVKSADVVVENWRPKVKVKFGLDYNTLKNINPRIILASISGFGQDGPYADLPAFDQIIQGMGGLMSVTGIPGEGPVRAGIAVSDSSSGLYCAIGILIALVERGNSGMGQWVQTSLLHSLIAMMDFQGARYLNEKQEPKQEGNNHPTTTPMGLFEASDGYINIGVAGDGMWRKFCGILNRSDWLDDERFDSGAKRTANRQALNDQIGDALKQADVRHWIGLFTRAGIPAGPVYKVSQVFDDPQVKHLKVEVARPIKGIGEEHYITQPVLLSRTPAAVKNSAPMLGENSAEILKELGYGELEIVGMHKAGIV